MRKVLIADRGIAAVRIATACADVGLQSVAVYADADADALHVAAATEAYALGGETAASYLDPDRILAIADRSGADGIHPGSGALAGNADFARGVSDAGLTWIGPSPQTLQLLADPAAVSALATGAGATLPPTLPAGNGSGPPALPMAGGRRIDVQVLADATSTVIVGTREASLQRRSRALVEEAPAGFLPDGLSQRLCGTARDLLRALGYVGAGTVQYLVLADGAAYFLGVDPALAPGFPATEETSGIDLATAQLRIANGECLPPEVGHAARGHALAFHVLAEDAARGFLPSPGTVRRFGLPLGPGLRADTAVAPGSLVPDGFDPSLATLTFTAPNRTQALRRARRALHGVQISGVATLLPLFRAVANDPGFEAGDKLHTEWIARGLSVPVAPDPEFSPVGPDASRATITAEVDGKRVAVGLPANLLAALLDGGHSLPSDIDGFQDV